MVVQVVIVQTVVTVTMEPQPHVEMRPQVKPQSGVNVVGMVPSVHGVEKRPTTLVAPL